MLDNDLIRLFRPIVINGLTDAGFLNVSVLQSNQPTQQGIPVAPAIYFTKVGDKRYGFLRREDTWDPIESRMAHVETQFYETTFQMASLVLQDPKNTALYTASDLINEVAAIMQSDKTRAILRQAGVGILRVMDVRNPYFTDDSDQFEASPSFDFVLTHRQVRESEEPIIDNFEIDIYPI